jgi:hypothetical protein
MRQSDGVARPGAGNGLDARAILGLPDLRSPLLDDVPTSEAEARDRSQTASDRAGQADNRSSVVTNVDNIRGESNRFALKLDDDFEDDEFDEDDDEDDDNDRDDKEDEDDEEEPETWQVQAS